MNDAKAEAAIRQIMADRVHAMRTGDADLLASHYAPEATQYDLEPPLLHPAEELRDPARMRAWFATLSGACGANQQHRRHHLDRGGRRRSGARGAFRCTAAVEVMSSSGPVHFDVRDLTVVAGADVAYCHSLDRMGSHPGGAEGGFEIWFRSTVGFRRDGERWLITHEHRSTPFYMDNSFRAAVDLQPQVRP